MHGNNIQRGRAPVTDVDFLKGNTPRKPFILEVGKEASFLNDLDTLDVDLHDTPSR